MRIAFYAPLKPPSHPVPSGDRRIARLMLQALRLAGHEVRVVSAFRSFEPAGNRARQQQIQRRGAAEAKRLLRTPLARWRPDLWFTYHLYQKAPDWLGPPIARSLAIPYVVAEAAYAPRRSAGRWDLGLAAVASALRQAEAALLLNPNDEECVVPLLRRRAKVERLLPFLDTAPFRRAARRRDRHRRALARRFRIPAAPPWLLAVGMMRPGDKLASYRLLGRALAGLMRQPWRFIVVGDGPARGDVRRAFAPLRGRMHFLGALPQADLVPLYAASDLLVWPAINEAIGMAILEAQAAGLPAVAGAAGATGVIVAEGKTGQLAPLGLAVPFRRAVAELLARPELRHAMSTAAIAKTGRLHGIDCAAARLDEILRRAVERAGKQRRP